MSAMSSADGDAHRDDGPPAALPRRGDRRAARAGAGPAATTGAATRVDATGAAIAVMGAPTQRAAALEAQEVGAQVLRGLVALVDVLRHRGEHDAVDARRARRVPPTTAAPASRARACTRPTPAVGGERRDAGDHLVEHDAERVHVAAAVDREALRLLGREVGGGAHHRAGLGEAVRSCSARAMPKSVTFTCPAA